MGIPWVRKGPKSRKCGTCSRLLSCQSALNIHMRLHTGKKPHVCNFTDGTRVCTAAFAQAGTLKVHKRMHTGEKPFVCSCGAAFAQAGNLQNHKRRHHADEIAAPAGPEGPPFLCDVGNSGPWVPIDLK